MASLVKDYQHYKETQNVTFIGICTSSIGTVKSMQRQVDTFKLKPFANMLDSGGTTAAAYNLPTNANFRLVVIDGAGKIAYNAGRGWHWSSGPDKGKFIHQTQLDKSLKSYPGILGIKDEDIPSDMKLATHYYDLQQFNKVEAELKRAAAKNSSGEAKSFSKVMRDKISSHRIERMAQIKALQESNPVQAYREAIAFVQAFPRAPEMSELRKIGTALSRKKEVKKELDAENAFQRIMVPTMRKVTSLSAFKKKVDPLFRMYLQRYGKTKYAEVVKNAIKAQRAAVQ